MLVYVDFESDSSGFGGYQSVLKNGMREQYFSSIISNDGWNSCITISCASFTENSRRIKHAVLKRKKT